MKKIIIPIVIMAIFISCLGCSSKEISNNPPSQTNTTDNFVGQIPEEDNHLPKGSDVPKETEPTLAQVLSLRDTVPTVLKDARIGCAATQTELNDPKVWDIITTHFNAITLGNELKPDALFNYSCSTVPGLTQTELNGQTFEVPVLNYQRAEEMLDKIYEWNEANPDRKIEVRGHVLVWHSQTPEWFFHEDYDKTKPYVDKATMNLRLEWYIREVLTHFTGEESKYKDMFYGWDVVNEAVSDQSGKLRTDSENPGESLSEDRHGSNSSWFHIYGDNEFIINAFIYANKYAPDYLELYYNDYNECNTHKRNGIAELLTDIKANEGEKGVGTRIDGMGMQGHYSMTDPGFTDIEYSAKLYGSIVGSVQLTELDIRASDSYDGSENTKADENEKLRKRYHSIYFTLKSLQNNSGIRITGITFWGTVDHYSWLQSRSGVGGGNTTGLPQCPLLFDENYEPKPCFYVFTETD